VATDTRWRSALRAARQRPRREPRVVRSTGRRARRRLPVRPRLGAARMAGWGAHDAARGAVVPFSPP